MALFIDPSELEDLFAITESDTEEAEEEVNLIDEYNENEDIDICNGCICFSYICSELSENAILLISWEILLTPPSI